MFCAAGVEADKTCLRAVQQYISRHYDIQPAGFKYLEQAFLSKAGGRQILQLLPKLNPMPLTLNYALLNRYLEK